MRNALARKALFYYAMGSGYWLSKIKDTLRMRQLRMQPDMGFFRGCGLEVGGKSPVFESHGLLPIYGTCTRIDNVTYSHCTAWEGEVNVGDTFQFHGAKARGRQFVMEGADLGALPAGAYDFVASSHMLEHAANPIAVLQAWKRVLKDDGTLLLVLPHRDGTFDHRRPITRIEHLIKDYEDRSDEGDQTHLEEILKFHDLRRDASQNSRTEFE